MLEISGDILTYQTSSEKTLRCFTSNGNVKSNGELVCGKGVALSFRQKWPEIALWLGQLVRQGGNHVYVLDSIKVASFPTKNHWKNDSSLSLIEQSCQELVKKSSAYDYVLLTRPGCGNGNLSWEAVKPVLEKYFTTNKFIILNQ